MPPSTARAEPDTSFAPIPRGERRRREIAAVAEQVFFENGFTDTTMQTIAARAGASKETLYRHFGSKEELFAEIVENRAKHFLGGLDENFARPGSVAEALRDLGTRLLEAMVGPEGISLCRTVAAEAARNPDLGVLFFAQGPERVLARLAEFLEAARDRGEIDCADTGRAARIFIGAVTGTFHLARLVLQTPPPVTEAQMRAHVDEVVAMFLGRFARAT